MYTSKRLGLPAGKAQMSVGESQLECSEWFFALRCQPRQEQDDVTLPLPKLTVMICCRTKEGVCMTGLNALPQCLIRVDRDTHHGTHPLRFAKAAASVLEVAASFQRPGRRIHKVINLHRHRDRARLMVILLMRCVTTLSSC